jgi:hypothetical protein
VHTIICGAMSSHVMSCRVIAVIPLVSGIAKYPNTAMMRDIAANTIMPRRERVVELSHKYDVRIYTDTQRVCKKLEEKGRGCRGGHGEEGIGESAEEKGEEEIG